MSLQILLYYLVCMCIWTRPFHAHNSFDPCDLHLELRNYYPHAFRRKSGDIVVMSVRPDHLFTYTISTRTLKLTHMVDMSICATVNYLEL